MKIIIGAGEKSQEGWISLEQNQLDITRREDFIHFLEGEEEIECILAEHVLEHLSEDDLMLALKNCHEFLNYKGRMRIAVPDGYHPDPAYIEYVKPQGTGAGADSHQILFDYETLSDYLTKAGFVVDLLEWWDEDHRLHAMPWYEQDGNIERCIANDPRNRDGYPHYTSLIVDAYKDKDPTRPGLAKAFAFIERNDIYKLSPFNRKKTTTFYELGRLAPANGSIVELGSYHGNGTSALWYGTQDGNKCPVVAVDAYKEMRGWANEPYTPDDKDIWIRNIKKAHIQPYLYEEDASVLSKIWEDPISLIVHDLGTKKRMLKDIMEWERYVIKGGIIALRDIDDFSMGTEETIGYLLKTKRWGFRIDWDGFITSVRRL